MFAWLGSIQIGMSPFTGPTQGHETTKSTFAKISVAEGKPVVQDRGDELNVKKLHFFFDESFCNPASELARLEGARAARSPLPWTYGDGSYTGARYMVEQIDVTLKKTTAFGRIVRVEAQLQLLEAPISDLGAFASLMAVLGAPALAGAARLNIGVKIQ
jgi:hypothetical protein